ncbi:porin [Hydrogenophaga electricum]|uniref:Porin domain-containing protein n=1 Tax=Hydrogenophaga electricum TaxID=1230953 RepID=A0ABQ6C754_9BURK|nr:porin [Hydrogenophaga electricum]GLS14590.1 hypothetical protein GCM10007935_20210 [Hydrogenophaga electricum]
MALAAAVAPLGVAWAQSNVTVFGLLDVNLRRIEVGQASRTEVHHSIVVGSRLGFRGTEDLGGGLTAGFWLETAFSPDTGTTPPRVFHSRSTPGLKGSGGELRVGPDLTASFQGFVYYDPFAVNDAGSVQNVFGGSGYALGSGATTSSRTDHAISYFLPADLGGFNGQVMYAPSEGMPGKRYVGARLGYARGPRGVPVGTHGTLCASSVPKDASGASTDGNDAPAVRAGVSAPLVQATMLYGAYSQIHNKGASNATVGSTQPGVARQDSRGLELGLVRAF